MRKLKLNEPKDYTHITVLLDRSGSMANIREATIDGFNTFLSDQKELPGKATITLILFDSEDPYEVVYQFMDIKDATPLTVDEFVPRAETPLLDAMGRGILDIENTINKMSREDRPDGVMFVVVTDGWENRSSEFKKDQINKMLTQKQDKEGWEILYLSADMNAINDARSYGITGQCVAAYNATPMGTADGFANVSRAASTYRGGGTAE